MHIRRISNEAIDMQVRLRKLVNSALNSFSIHNLHRSLETETALLELIKELKEMQFIKRDIALYGCIEYLFIAFFQLLRHNVAKQKGEPGSDALRQALNTNVTLFLELASGIDLTNPFSKAMIRVIHEIRTCTVITTIPPIAENIRKLNFPFVATIRTSRFGDILDRKNKGQTIVEDDPGETKNTILISVLLYLDKHPWANPQNVKTNILYTINGTLRINQWPEGYDTIALEHSSTAGPQTFDLVLSVIQRTNADMDTFPVSGTILLKYPQPAFDPPMSIKLFARLSGNGMETIFPTVIGYDQLIVRVTDKTSLPFLTGFDILDEKAIEIITAIRQEMPLISQGELVDFTKLFTAMLNYQGYCAQSGEYKNISNLSEDDFRDNLIRYLSPDVMLASQIIKEGQLSGGRVEIRYKNIIAELKVERTISDRDKMIEQYTKQPGAYAAATGAQLSILCILDLTAKMNPPAITARNVFLLSPSHHGFEDDSTLSRLAVIIIDGNTPNPSAYKK